MGKAIEPGEEYRVTYGDGRTLIAKAIGFRKQRALLAALERVRDPQLS